MGCCLAMGWAPVITGAGWGTGVVQREVHVEELATHMEGKGRQRHIHCVWQLASWLYSGQGKAHQVCINMCMIPYDFVKYGILN